MHWKGMVVDEFRGHNANLLIKVDKSMLAEAYCQRFALRYSDGLRPVTSLKTLQKYFGSR
jgi:hypothetical protein